MSINDGINCLHCGAPLTVRADSLKVQCRYCKRIYENVSKNITYELKEISHRRQLREFVQAEELCALQKPRMPKCGELYWQSLLTEFGIVYVNDSVKQIPVPTFFHHSYEKGHELRDSENYKLALQYAATADDTDFYKTQGEELDAILKRHFELMAKEPPYNIFISFKSSYTETLQDGREITLETPDIKTGREIYELFTKRKYNVFFSPESIGKDKSLKGMDYEPRILKALQTSQAMVLLASKSEYLSSEWVENEWKRYMYFIEKGKKLARSLVIVYFDRPPKLPAALGGKIEHTMIDAHSMNFKEELSRALDFVKPGSKKTVQIKREIKTDFEEETLEYTGASERVNFGGTRNITHISASEAREMQNANIYLLNSNFNVAYNSFKKIADNNPSNGKAYWGMFLSRVKIKLPEKYITGKLKGAYPTDITAPDDLIFNFKSVHSDAFTLLEKAITNPTDEEFTDNVIAVLMYQIARSENKAYMTKLFELLAKYIPNKSIKNLLDIMKGHCIAATKAGDIKYARSLYSASEEKLFIAENDAFNKAYLKDFANALYYAGEYDTAIEYYNKYLKARHEAAIYWNLLGCRLGGSPMQAFKLRIHPEDDAAKKEPMDLDYDEIIERIVVCSKCDFETAAMKDLMRLLSYQIQNNFKNHKAFVECIAGCVLSVAGEAAYLSFLDKIATVMIFERRFSEAKLYFTQMDSALEESDELPKMLGQTAVDEYRSSIRWGLLKCRLKAIDDYEVCRTKKKLESYPEYRDAINCATDAQYRYFSSIYGAHQNRNEDQMRKFACTPQLRKFSPNAKEIVPQFGKVESFYNPATLKTKDAKSAHSAKVAGRVLAAILVLAVLAAGAYFAFIKTCTVSFDTGGMVEIPDTVTNYFRKIDEPMKPEKSGYTFRGWYNERGKKWEFGSTITWGNTVLHPEWDWGTEGLVYESYVDVVSGVHRGLKVTGYYGTDTLINIPASYKGTPVIAIGGSAFYGNDSITKVVLSSGIETISGGAFSMCYSLERIYIPLSVENCSMNSFANSPAVKFVLQCDDSNGYSVTTPSVEGYLDYNRILYANGITEDGYAYKIKYDINNTTYPPTSTPISATITGYFGGENIVKIPEKIETLDVISIGTSAFEGDRGLVAVTIPESVTTVGAKAFASCGRLISLVNKSASLALEEGAFSTDFTLVELYDASGAISSICKSVTNKHDTPDFESNVSVLYGGYVFVNASGEDEGEELPTLIKYVGYGLTAKLPVSAFGKNYNIGKSAFENAKGIVELIISGGVKEIEDYAFSGCKGLKSAIIPDTVEYIGYDAFASCPELTVYMSADAVPESYNENWNWSGAEVVLGCTSEYGVTEDGIEWIKKNDNTVIIIGLSGKPDDRPSGYINVTPVFDPETNAYKFSADTYSVTVPEKIGEGTVSAIAKSAFRDRYYMGALSIPATVVNMPDGMLSGCVLLRELTIPEVGKTVYEDVELKAPEIIEPDVDVEVGTEGEMADVSEGENTENTENTEGESTEGENAGNADSENTESVIVTVLKESYPLGVLFGTKQTTYYYFSNGVKIDGNTYGTDGASMKQINQGYITDFSVLGTQLYCIPEGLVSVKVLGGEVAPYAFSGCDMIQKVVIEGEGDKIGADAFRDCSALTLVTMPDTVTEIGDYAFEGCERLAVIELSFATAKIGEGAFKNCYALPSIPLPEGVTSIGGDAFVNCRLLKFIVIPTSVETLPRGLFSGCGALTSMTLPYVGAGVANNTAPHPLFTIGYLFGTESYSYTVNNGIEDVEYTSVPVIHNIEADTEYMIPSGLKSISITGGTLVADFAFANMTMLESISLGTGITEIGRYAFTSCSALNSVKLPASLSVIGFSAFANCTSLSSVQFPIALSTIDSAAFSNCSQLSLVDLPAGLVTVDADAFDTNAEKPMFYYPLDKIPDTWHESWCDRSVAYVIRGYTGANVKYSFVNQGGERVDAITSNRFIELPVPTNGTKYFVGWYDNPDFEGYYYYGAYYSPSDVTLYARWSDEPLIGTSFDNAVLLYGAISDTGTVYNYYTDASADGVFEYYGGKEANRCTFTVAGDIFAAITLEIYDKDRNLIKSETADGGNLAVTVDYTVGEKLYVVLKVTINYEGSYTITVKPEIVTADQENGADDTVE